MPDPFSLSVHFFGQLTVILVTCWLAGLALRPLGQPQVVAQIIAGFLLGPSLLGLIAPQVASWLFPTTIVLGGLASTEVTHPSGPILYTVGQIGIVLFMFNVGLELDRGLIASHIKRTTAISLVGIAVPFTLGAALGYVLHTHGIFPKGLHPVAAALFLGAAISITAFPVLAGIITNSGLQHTKVGVITLGSAAIDDLFAWLLLAVVLTVAAGSALQAATTAIGTVLFLLVLLLVLRPLLAAASRRVAHRGALDGLTLTIVACLLFACAWATDMVGVYSVFGAFMMGLITARGTMATELSRVLHPLTSTVLLPVFFVVPGLNTKITLLLDTHTLLVFLAVLAVAILGKGGACFLVARRSGLSMPESASVGALMNARGLMELVLLNVGMQKGLVTPQLYTILALMTIITTLAASPILQWTQRLSPAPQPVTPRDNLGAS